MSDRLDAIEARHNKTTFGPWQHVPYGGQNQNGDYAGGYIIDGHGEWLLSDVSDADGPFIAHTPEDVAYLLDLARKQQAKLDAVRVEVSMWEERCTTDNTGDVALRAGAYKIRAALERTTHP